MAIDEGIIPCFSKSSSTRGQAMDQPWAQQPIRVGAIAIGICHIFHHLRPSRPVLLAPERNGSLFGAPDRCYKSIVYNIIPYI